ncbi:type VI secretion system baseplate subunit TssF [Pendulispora brunnea]|uniref:Type VI secretion system baseplate subunit TssF n=1 Tax=Pendulispora brunnea TaxID=2905690 RepID=A0ABZ2KHF9_9BACT
MFRHLIEAALNETERGFQGLARRYPRLEPLLASDELRAFAQWVAFALASIDEQRHDDHQGMLRALVAQAFPQCLRPRPSSTILQLAADRSHAGDLLGTVFRGRAGALEMPFRVMWSITPTPFEMADARVERIHAKLQVLRITLVGREGIVLGGVLPERVRFFVHPGDEADGRGVRTALDLIHALRTADNLEVDAFDGEGNVSHIRLPAGSLRWVRIDTEEPSLLSAPRGRFRSSTLLTDLCAFPESFSFFEIDLGPVRSPKTTRIELTLPLARVVDAASSFHRENLRLFCVPATNEYVAPIEPLRAERGPEWELLVAQRPHAEILHVRSIHTESARGRFDVVSLEAPDRPLTFAAGHHYYLLKQTIARDESRTEMRLTFAARQGFRAPAPAALTLGEVLASDGLRTESLGLRDIGGRNITRVTPSHRAILQGLAMRMNAFARMSPHRFAEPAHLREFVRLHEPPNPRERRIRLPEILEMHHERESRMQPGAEWEQGDHFQLTVDGSASVGEMWLLREILSRALTERQNRLRFSRLTLERSGTHPTKDFTNYDAREGERHAAPLG